MTMKNTHGKGRPRDPFNGFVSTTKTRKAIDNERALFSARAQKWLDDNCMDVFDAAVAFKEHLPGHELVAVYNRAWKWIKRGVVPQKNYQTLLAPHFKDCPLFK